MQLCILYILCGEAEARSIYGEATNDEASRLSEEGVAFRRIPWAPREDA